MTTMANFVTFSPSQPTSLTMAAGQARTIADRGEVAIISVTGLPGPGVYITRTEDGRYELIPASLWEPDWLPRLRRILDNFVDE